MTEVEGYPLRMTLSGHAGPINSVAVAPDGAFVVSVSDDTTLKLWDRATGEELRTLYGHTETVWDCAVSVDGRWLVSASGDGTLKLWSPSSGEQLCTLAGHSDSVTGCAFSLDARGIVSASADGTLKVWDRASGEELRTLNADTERVWDCALSFDGRMLASAGDDGRLKLWDPASGELLCTLAGHTGWVSACTVSPDGSFIVSAGRDKTLKLWDAASGHQLGTLEGHLGPIRDCAVSPDGGFIVSASDDGTLKLWDPARLRELSTLPGSRCCAIGPDGAVVSGSDKGTVTIWSEREVRARTESGLRLAEAVDTAMNEFKSIMRSAEGGVRDAEHFRELSDRLQWLRRSMPTRDEATSAEARATLEELSEAVDRSLDSLASHESGVRLTAAVESAVVELQSIMRSAEGGVRGAEHHRELRDRLQRLKRSMPDPHEEASDEATAAHKEISRLIDDKLDELSSLGPRIVGAMHERTTPPMESPPPIPMERPAAVQIPELLGRGEGVDSIDCTVFSPPTAPKGDSFLVQVFAHMPAQASDARALATEFDERATARGFTGLTMAIARGTELGFELTMPGLDIDQPVRSLVWDGRAQGVSFGVTVPSRYARRNALGRVAVSAGRLPVGEITFKIGIVTSSKRQEDAAPRPVGDAHQYELTFVSYARRDRRKVSYCVQVMETYGVRFFQDILHISRGARWEKELYRRIEESDCFLLFWSKKAKKSSWVEKEVLYALARKLDVELDAHDSRDQMRTKVLRALEEKEWDELAPPSIQPILIQGPPIPPPWDILAHLQFDDEKIYRGPSESLWGRLRGTRRRHRRAEAPA